MNQQEQRKQKRLRLLNRVIYAVNAPYHIAKHLIGENHTPMHRKVIGVLVMLVGGTIVGIATAISHSVVGHIVGDVIGNGVHGIGLIPFIKEVEGVIEKKVENSIVNPKNPTT